MIKLSRLKKAIYWPGALVVLAACQAFAQPPAVSSRPPIIDPVQTHHRVIQEHVPGRRIELKSVKGSRLFVGPAVDPARGVRLIIHFHGAAWLLEKHIAEHLPRAVLITVNLGAVSSVYDNPFKQRDAFQLLIDEAKEALQLKRPWSSITLTGFSAGYGAVRAILRHENYFAIVDHVLLLDGIHASYRPEGKTLSDGGEVNARDLDSFLRFAGEAAAGRKVFVITHSQIFPGTYASTPESTDYLLAKLGLRRKREPGKGPMGMSRLSVAGSGRFRVLGYAGDTAADHVDHLHAMPFWIESIGLK